jgi:DNA modification methylase
MKNIEIHNEYHEDNKITLYHGDALSFLKTMSNESVHLVVSSPPYNMQKEYENKAPLFTYLAEQRGVIQEIIRVLKPDGNICWQVGNYIEDGELFPLDIFYYHIFKSFKAPLFLRNRVVWHFGHGLHAKHKFSGRYETILCFAKSKTSTFNLDQVRVPQKYPGKKHFKGPRKGQLSCNPLGKNPSDFWEFQLDTTHNEVWCIPNVKHNHPEKTIHPCQYPIELAERCILAMSNIGELVLDPYAGVSTTIVATIKHGRKAIGVEKESKYIDVGKIRIQKFLEEMDDVTRNASNNDNTSFCSFRNKTDL